MTDWREDTPYDREEMPDHKEEERPQKIYEWLYFDEDNKEYKGDKKHREQVVIPIMLRDFNNELDDLARILNNMKIANVPEYKSNNV